MPLQHRRYRLPTDPREVLFGLRPGLVADLAQLAGSTMDDLKVTFQVLSFGDRATLAAYGLIEMNSSAEHPRAVVGVSELMLEVISTAAQAAGRVAANHLPELTVALREC